MSINLPILEMSTNGVEAGQNLLTNVLDTALALVGDFFELVTANWWWAIAIAGLMYVESAAIDRFNIPFPMGNLRWILLFFITMFFSWIWMDIIGGLLPSG